METVNREQKVIVYDTTLRDGAQGEGVHFSVKDKLLYVQKMAEINLPFIEAGWPGANPRDEEFFRLAADLSFKNTKIAAFGSTCKVNESPEQSDILANLLASGAPVITIFGKAWNLHVREVLRTTLGENLRLIRESVEYLVRNGREVFFDAEHFFDGWLENPAYALSCIEAAMEGGALVIILCDTNGGVLPADVTRGVRDVNRRLSPQELGIHAHNDSGLAVANSLAAVEAGVTQIQGAWNGFGERCGNANLSTLIPVLQLKLGYQVMDNSVISRLTHLSRYVAELANFPFDEKQPFVGRSAFAHKAGMHVDGVLKTRRSFEHIVPSQVGNEGRILISDQAGKANIWERMQHYQPDILKNDIRVEEAMVQIKSLENQGFQFEIAEGSLDLRLQKILGQFAPPFQLVDYHVWSDPLRGDLDSVAVVKLQVGEETVHIASEGCGPVNALDQALRQALCTFFPVIEKSELVDYKVRVLDESSGTEAVVRVIVETCLGTDKWGTIGVSSNILKASAQALLDSLYVTISKGNISKDLTAGL
ncbi:MAG: citramalate synthase [Desulfitobacteriaceae bacterium]|nr:citramalate synthase [Desulfitobacteriaceae bacterium]MDD4345729.1 citramalate synthase [Desulfitobacteriaceae bacterium]MDD4400413.1 citramalate synthase [Desulfitobacteriaceae bacterium]